MSFKPKLSQHEIAQQILMYASPEQKAKMIAERPWLKAADKPVQVRVERGHEEDDLQIEIVKYLRSETSIMVWSNPKQIFKGKPTKGQLWHLEKLKRMGATKGIPDLSLLYGGKFSFVELKKPGGGVVSPEQKDRLKACTENGGYSCVVRSVDELKAFIRQVY